MEKSEFKGIVGQVLKEAFDAYSASDLDLRPKSLRVKFFGI
ncbi:MAG: hypothetical protein ACLUKN_15925 [Bacilli bacterium]